LHRVIFSFRSILTVAARTPSSGRMTADLYATTRFSLSEDDGLVSTVAVVNRVLRAQIFLGMGATAAKPI
jgi:hypothetical protein